MCELIFVSNKEICNKNFQFTVYLTKKRALFLIKKIVFENLFASRNFHFPNHKNEKQEFVASPSDVWGFAIANQMH